MAYATEEQLAAFLAGSDQTAPTGDAAERLLQRASELVDDHVTGCYDTDPDTSLPTSTDVATALQNATCAVVEAWLEVGEELDIAGFPPNTGLSTDGMGTSALPAVLPPRARRFLRRQGLIGAAVLR